MKYSHVLNYVGSTPWAILGSKMDDILSFLALRAAGGTLTPEEIQARIGERTAGAPSKQGAVAVIPLRGVITHHVGSMEEFSGGMSAERFTAMFQQAVADESVGTIVIDTDSPGGTIPGVPEAADAVFAARGIKRVVAVANATMASAAYWIASQADEIVAIPSALDASIGSIGVFTVHQDLSAYLEKKGIKTTLIRAGKFKADVNPWTPLTDDQREEIQGTVNSAYDSFVKAVARGRGVTPTAVRSGFGEGRALSAVDAKAAGMIDRIATFDEILHQAVGGRSAGGRMRADEEQRGRLERF